MADTSVPLPCDYDKDYYAEYAGPPYVREEKHWWNFFGGIADRVVAEIAPKTVLDVGCALGFLVECLVERGVDAHGIDASEHAIASVRPDLSHRFELASLLDPLPDRRYDLVTCIEVLEHLPKDQVDIAVRNICALTDDVLMSSTPRDYDEVTHINVRPQEYWCGLFAKQGLFLDVEYDAAFVAPWAMRFRREPAYRAFTTHAREIRRLRDEAEGRNKLLLETRRRLSESTARVEELEERISTGNVGRLEGRLEADQRRLAAARSESDHLRAQLTDAMRREAELAERAALLDTPPVRAALLGHRGLRKAFPRGTRRGAVVGAAGRGSVNIAGRAAHAIVARRATRRAEAPALRQRAVDHHRIEYAAWLARNEPTEAMLEELRAEVQTWQDRPLVSIVMPVYNSQIWWLEAGVNSVVAQAYDRWELCIADDFSSHEEVREHLRAWAARDARIKLVERSSNGGISAASNSALGVATGELIAFLDHDDELRPHALASMVRHFREHPRVGYAYSDEDKVSPDGTRHDPFFKPDWSPSLMLSANYTCHLSVVRREIIDRVGGFRSEFDGSQDYDLFLRVIDSGCAIGHVPEVLYSWRIVPGSAAGSTTAKPYAYEAAERALGAALARRGQSGHIGPGKYLGWYHVRYSLEGEPSVAIVIPTRDSVHLLRACITSVEARTTYRNWAIVVVDNGSVEPQTLEYLSGLRYTVVRDDGAFNFSRLCNRGVEATKADHVLLLNNDVEVVTHEWLEPLLEHSTQQDVGAVGCRLAYPDGSVQHEGVCIGYSGVPAANVDFGGWFGLSDATREVSAVTGACLMVKRSRYWELGGLDEALGVAYNDVDFCLRLHEKGYRNVYTPLATLVHAESATRRALHPEADIDIFLQRWGDVPNLRDPYLNPAIWSLAPIHLRVPPHVP